MRVCVQVKECTPWPARQLSTCGTSILCDSKARPATYHSCESGLPQAEQTQSTPAQRHGDYHCIDVECDWQFGITASAHFYAGDRGFRVQVEAAEEEEG